jgi:hypothetical protein
MTKKLTVVLAALALGVAGCGESGGDRENLERGNQDREVPTGTPSTIETGPTQLTPTGEEQPEVTQPQEGVE